MFGKRGQPSTPSVRPDLPPNGPAWLRSPVGLGKAVAVLLGLVVAGDLFAVYAGVTVYDVMGSLADQGVPYAAYVTVRSDAAHADSLYAAAGYIQTASLLATAVVYLVWFKCVRINAEVFNPFGHTMKRGWTVWCWFVPVVSLWFPRRIMLDIWDASIPADTRASHGLVNAWWTLWLVALFTSRNDFGTYSPADTAEKIRVAVGQALFSDAADIAAAVLAIFVVLRLTRMQNEKALQGPGSAGV
ncbi:hypothetical protein ADL01_33935 [Streptomyces sp. NRRL WC-3618]|uniref:DUF4328 domain-containing protein n=1 Tax=Streptomyces sp. NRRL WC-3618 TaxID=1519490 RepID=UPI0006ADBD01|nr:DUF4328 domain-containing protein [Streptomyces sp. NRRL WC-3618]KOV60113.1 hypothetical protein ADL01_33935 [Streptomyces sp. NRRL WC-3618]